MRRRVVFGLVLGSLAAIAGGALLACTQAQTPPPVRTFERAQRMDVVCLRVLNEQGAPIAPQPLPQEECAPVPSYDEGQRDIYRGGSGTLSNQLFGLVTQSSRGEVAVVALSAGQIVDVSQARPGINFLPVGALPTDIVTAPDGKMAFVASAEVNKFALYGIDARRVLGDTPGVPNPNGTPSLTSWPVCGLPQVPGALAVVPRAAQPSGSADAGADAGDAGAGSADTPSYDIIAVLPGSRTASAKVLTIDPRPLLRGAGLHRLANGSIDPAIGDGPAVAPGSLQPCPITSAVELGGANAVPSSVQRAGAWPDGIPYVDGGVDLTCTLPAPAASCGPAPCCASTGGGTSTGAGDAGDGGVAEAGASDAGACAPVVPNSAKDAGTVTLTLGPVDPPHLVAAARDGQMLYVADEGVPLIHVLDLSVPGAPRELPPLVATSLADPSRVVGVSALAVSPPTRDYKRYLYAVDRTDGSIMVFDVTEPTTAPRSPLVRPHAELNPFHPADRISFASPVVAVSFARHDWSPTPAGNALTSVSGVLCNPNPNLDNNPGADPGYLYRAGSSQAALTLGPQRLRGIFGFATLANGEVIAIDVDDWDAPCRRPQNMTGSGTAADGGTLFPSSLAVVQPGPAAGDLDPYHAPLPSANVVTDEAYFPVSAPHRVRSSQYLRDDPATGKHVPYLSGQPAVDHAGTPLLIQGKGSEGTPILRPTAVNAGDLASVDPGVGFSYEVPDVHLDQDWAVTFEGALPGFDGLTATLDTTDGYQSLSLQAPQARFCARGVEDWFTSAPRAVAISSELANQGRPAPGHLDRRMMDYIEVTDELLPPEDPYWSMPDDPGQCWSPSTPPGAARYNACSAAFGAAGDESPARDFPIVEAYDDHLVLGRFYTPASGLREIVSQDPTNAVVLKMLRCCFHNQVGFRVRASSQWIAVGSAFGFLSHLTTGDGGRCVPSCDPNLVLLNGRAPALPAGQTVAPTRNSPLALRNPALSFFLTNGVSPAGADTLPVRDTRWRFSTRGQFVPLFVNLAASTTAVNPQSMRYIDTLGEIAVVDAASQGLVLIDLSRVPVAGAPYF